MANPRKSHFLISPYEAKSIQIQNLYIKASFFEELLLIKIDSNLTYRDKEKTNVNEILYFITI